MPENGPENHPAAQAMARLQEAHNQYMTAFQDAWTALLKSYNESIACQMQAQQDLLKGGTCVPPPRRK
jgi:hypothetical protein